MIRTLQQCMEKTFFPTHPIPNLPVFFSKSTILIGFLCIFSEFLYATTRVANIYF